MASWRLFTAVPLPTALEDEIGEVLSGLSVFQEIKWVSPSQLHLTLFFLGNRDEAMVPSLIEALSGVASGFVPFDSGLMGLGAFPNLTRPKVFFVPVVKGEKRFEALSRRLNEKLQGLGITREKNKFHPHVTLGRVREGRTGEAVSGRMKAGFLSRTLEWKTGSFILFRSQLTPGGPIYTPLKEFTLGD